MLNRIVLILLVVACVGGLTAAYLRELQAKNRDAMACDAIGGVTEYQVIDGKPQQVCAWRPAPDRVLR